MKVSQNLIPIILIALISLSSCNTGGKGESVLISNDSIVFEDDYCKVNMTYPVVGFQLLDDSIQYLINSTVDEFKALSYQTPDTFYRPYTLDVNYELSVVNKYFTSVLLSNYQYTGGAHGNTTYTSFLYNKDSNKLLFLRDIIAKGSFAELRELVRGKLNTQLDFSDFVNDGTESMSSFDTFLLEEDGITFIFEPYAVAPYSTGTQRVKISNTEFSFRVFN